MSPLNYRKIWERVLCENLHLLQWFSYPKKVKIKKDGTFEDNWAYEKTAKHFPSLIKIYRERIALEEQRR